MTKPPISSGSEERELLGDRQAFAYRLAQTFEPRDVIELLLRTGLRYSDLALALKVHPRTVRAWMEDEQRDPARQRDGILLLKALMLFLLRRGVLSPRQLALWLVEPNDQLDFRRPLAVFAERGVDDVINASGAFTRPEPSMGSAPERAVAAGAAGRQVQEPMPEAVEVSDQRRSDRADGDA